MLPFPLVRPVRASGVPAPLAPIVVSAIALVVLGACAAPAPPDASPFYLAPPATGRASAAPGLDSGTHRNRGQSDGGSPQGLPGSGYSSPSGSPSDAITPGNGSMSFGSGGGG